MAKSFLIALFAYIVLDAVWFRLVARQFYADQLKTLMRPTFGGDQMAWAIGVYILLALGTIFFVLPKTGSPLITLGLGALYGLIIYGVYDLTNFVFIVDWPLAVVVVDVMWGVVVSSVVALAVSRLS